MKFDKFSSAWMAAAIIVVGAIVAGCGGGSHTAIPGTSTPATSGSTAQVAGTSGQPGTMSISVRLPDSGTLPNSTQRSPQYVSGKTQGLYITGTCITGTQPAGVFSGPPTSPPVTQSSCVGAAFAPVYADVSSTSLLCNAGTCTISANPVPGFFYQITVAILDTKPTGAVSGYGTGFATTANLLAVGSNPGPLPAATGSPGPSPTPTTFGPKINAGSANNVSIQLNPIATKFTRLPGGAGFVATDNVLSATANGALTSVNVFWAAGDAASNLISSSSGCIKTYSVTATSYTVLNAAPPGTACDDYAGPDGKLYSLTLTSSLPTHVCATAVTSGFATPPPAPTSCTVAGTFPSLFEWDDFAPLYESYGNWYQQPQGVMNKDLFWDGLADNDTCTAIFTSTGATPAPQPKCGQPMAITMNNNIPTTATPLIGNPSVANYAVSNPLGFLIAPVVTTLSCGSNPSCVAVQTQTGCTSGYCYQIGLDNGGTATATIYFYASGGGSSLTANTGCYATASCLGVAINNSPPTSIGTNISSCYTAVSSSTGVTSGTPGCNDVPDPNASPNGSATLPAGTVDCLTPSAAGSPNALIAQIIPRSFVKGALATSTTVLGTADSMTFTVLAVPGTATPNSGTCRFEVWSTGRSGTIAPSIGDGTTVGSFPIPGPTALVRYSSTVTVNVSSNNTVILVPPTNTFP